VNGCSSSPNGKDLSSESLVLSLELLINRKEILIIVFGGECIGTFFVSVMAKSVNGFLATLVRVVIKPGRGRIARS